MATPTRDIHWEARKEEAKKLIAAGGCFAIKFWNNTDAISLCPPEHQPELKFEPLEGMVYISEWEEAAKKAIELISRGLDLLNKKSAPAPSLPSIEPEEENEKWHPQDYSGKNAAPSDTKEKEIPGELSVENCTIKQYEQLVREMEHTIAVQKKKLEGLELSAQNLLDQNVYLCAERDRGYPGWTKMEERMAALEKEKKELYDWVVSHH